ncbi:MAG: hypothetical protein FVQ83_16595 [Chloroflexi bacterium]|nr:hypothetical protein [Chloroflexota bacterium]
MIIHQTQTKLVEKSVFLYARVETNHPVPNMPQTLWFEFPQNYVDQLDSSSNSMLLTLVQLGMMLGEDITVKGVVSPRLAYGLNEYQNIYHTWLPDTFHLVNIKCAQLSANNTNPSPTGVATAFSGGVDSFFTLWSHLPRNQTISPAQITHGLFVHGFDIPLTNSELYSRLLQQYEKTFSSIDLTLIPVRTNAKLFYQLRINWTLTYGAPLIATAYALSPSFRRLYIPSGFNYGEIVPNGSTPLHDHLVSSEQLEIVHHGAGTSRVEKFSTISDWSLTHDQLRVCIQPSKLDDHINCGKCNKCLSGITTLKNLNYLDLYSVFPPSKPLLVIANWILVSDMYVPYVMKIQREAFRHGKWGTGLLMTLPIFAGWIKNLAKNIFRKILSSNNVYDLKVKRYGLDEDSYFATHPIID